MPVDELFSLWQRVQLRYLIVACALEINCQDETIEFIPFILKPRALNMLTYTTSA